MAARRLLPQVMIMCPATETTWRRGSSPCPTETSIGCDSNSSYSTAGHAARGTCGRRARPSPRGRRVRFDQLTDRRPEPSVGTRLSGCASWTWTLRNGQYAPGIRHSKWWGAERLLGGSCHVVARGDRTRLPTRRSSTGARAVRVWRTGGRENLTLRPEQCGRSGVRRRPDRASRRG
jgi:hypothetical protein